MKYFNAKFILDSATAVENGYEISATIVDNTGNYFASDIKANDVVYLNGIAIGELLLRYKIVSVTNATGAVVTGVMAWDIDDVEAVEPFAGMEGIIGESIEGTKLSMIGGIFTNACDETVISAARSYEQKLMTSDVKSIPKPTIGYEPVV